MKALKLNSLLLLCALFITACNGGGGKGPVSGQSPVQNPQQTETPKPVDESKHLELVTKLEKLWSKVDLKWANMNDLSKSVLFGRNSTELSKHLSEKELESVFLSFKLASEERRNPDFEFIARSLAN